MWVPASSLVDGLDEDLNSNDEKLSDNGKFIKF